MTSIKEYIESGILELYVSGNTSPEESAKVEHLAVLHPEIAEEIEMIVAATEAYAIVRSVEPDATIKPFLMATIDYSERLKSGEAMTFPPEINNDSVIADYSEWVDRSDMIAPAQLPSLYAKIIGYTPTMTTAIAWIKEMAPHEVHNNQIEKFLIVEGTCDITIGDDVHQLIPGDVLSIPLYKDHFVKVTSSIPCKVILQRIAA